MFYNYEKATNKTLGYIIESAEELNNLFVNHQHRIFALEKKILQQDMEMHQMRISISELTRSHVTYKGDVLDA